MSNASDWMGYAGSSTAEMFDFGGGFNFNPGGGTGSGTAFPNGGNFNPTAVPGSTNSYNANNNPFGMQSNAVPSNSVGLGGPGGGGVPSLQRGSNSAPQYGTPSWSPNTSGGTTNPSTGLFTPVTGQGSGSTSVLPFYGGASTQNPSANLSGAFGPLGPYITSLIQTGGYNPQVLQNLLAQLQPQITQGEATIAANTGAAGTRFGSGYDLALGDFLSQVNLNEGALAAGLYQQGVQNSMSELQATQGTEAQYQSNQGGFLSSLFSSLLGDASGGISSGISKLVGLIPGLNQQQNNAGTYGLNSSSGSDQGTIGLTSNSGDPFGNDGNGGTSFWNQ